HWRQVAGGDRGVDPGPDHRDAARHRRAGGGGGVKFGPTPVAEATGAILAHSVSGKGFALKKGRVLSAADLAPLGVAGIQSGIAAGLERGDVREEEGATAVAEAAAGEGVTVQAAFTGRSNLYAKSGGIVVIDRERVDQINLVDESMTVATVAPYDLV